jgi:hypothetical protein
MEYFQVGFRTKVFLLTAEAQQGLDDLVKE